MKAYIGYALLVIGLPNILGLAAGYPLRYLFSHIELDANMRRLLDLLDVFNGFVCVMAGILIFHLLGLPPAFLIPVISGVWISIYLLPKKRFVPFYCNLGGIVGGWLFYMWFFAS